MKKTGEYVEVDLWQLLLALWRKGWAILLAAVLCGAGAVGASAVFLKPAYEARALLYVNSSVSSPASTKQSVSQSELYAAQSLVETYLAVLDTRTVMETVLARSGADYELEELEKMVAGSAVEGTELLCIAVTGPEPEEAARLADTAAVVLQERVEEVVEGCSARIVETAAVPEEPVSPDLWKNGLIGAVFGIVLSCGAVLFRELAEDRIRDAAFLRRNFEIPVLGEVTEGCRDSGAYQRLWIQLKVRLGEDGRCMLGTASASAEDGKDGVAARLACVMARSGRRTLLVKGSREGGEVVKAGKDLYVMTGMEKLAVSLDAGEQKEALGTLAERFDWVLWDLPPVLESPEALTAASRLGGLVVLVRLGHCRRADLEAALQQLRFAGGRVLGFVVIGGRKR